MILEKYLLFSDDISNIGQPFLVRDEYLHTRQMLKLSVFFFSQKYEFLVIHISKIFQKKISLLFLELP